MVDEILKTNFRGGSFEEDPDLNALLDMGREQGTIPERILESLIYGGIDAYNAAGDIGQRLAGDLRRGTDAVTDSENILNFISEIQGMGEGLSSNLKSGADEVAKRTEEPRKALSNFGSELSRVFPGYAGEAKESLSSAVERMLSMFGGSESNETRSPLTYDVEEQEPAAPDPTAELLSTLIQQSEHTLNPDNFVAVGDDVRRGGGGSISRGSFSRSNPSIGEAANERARIKEAELQKKLADIANPPQMTPQEESVKLKEALLSGDFAQIASMTLDRPEALPNLLQTAKQLREDTLRALPRGYQARVEQGDISLPEAQQRRELAQDLLKKAVESGEFRDLAEPDNSSILEQILSIGLTRNKMPDISKIRKLASLSEDFSEEDLKKAILDSGSRDLKLKDIIDSLL